MTAERRDPSRLYGRASTFEGRRAVPSPEERGRLAEQRERLMSKDTKVGKTRHEAEGVSGMDVNARLAEWETLTEGATEGPWGYWGQGWIAPVRDPQCDPVGVPQNRIPRNDADAAFIAAARTAMPALLGFVREVQHILATQRHEVIGARGLREQDVVRARDIEQAARKWIGGEG